MRYLKHTLAYLFVATLLATAAAGADPPEAPAPPTTPDAAGPLRFVVSGNPSGQEAGLDLGTTYTAVPAFTNPADPDNTRLLDRGIPSENWHAVAGLNAPAQTVTFDLKMTCRIDAVALYFNHEQKPASVAVSVAAGPDGPWQSVGTLTKAEQTEAWWRLESGGVQGRYVRLDHKLDAWGWYLREVKIYGNVTTAPPGAAKRTEQGLVLVDDARALASIVVADRPAPPALRAATTLQRLVRRMTDVWLPIVSESEFEQGPAAILVGMSDLAAEHSVIVGQGPSAGDHYVIRTGSDYIALIGNDADALRGSVYAVYDLLERLGCGWYGPDPLWQIIPEKKALVVPAIDVHEVPALQWRSLWMHGMRSDELRDAWRLGGRALSIAHNLSPLVPPAEHKQDHPDWFGPEQPCLTHPEVIGLIVEDFSRQLRNAPADTVLAFSLSANDTGGFCECDRCKAVGNVSARMLHFANAIARKLHTTHPGRFLMTFLAYWHSHGPPVPLIRAEPGVCVMLVNEGDHTKPLDQPESAEHVAGTGRNNTRERAAIRDWQRTGGLHGTYEWWIPAIGNAIWKDMPWYSGETALRNLRFWNRGGVKYVFYESQGEHNGGFPIRWPQYYLAARGMWDPSLTADQIMAEACAKLYGAAAAPMRSYYAVFERAMLATGERGGNWHLPSPELIYTTPVEREADEWLQRAADAATAGGTQEQARIAEEHRLWQVAKAALQKLRAGKQAP